MSKLIQLNVNEEQELAIRAFLTFNDWEDCLCETTTDTVDSACTTSSTYNVNSLATQCTNTQATPLEAQPLEVVAPCDKYQDNECMECPHCFLQPCVTTLRQSWLGNGQSAKLANRAVRKAKYKKFWMVIDQRCGWRDARYLQRKASLLHREDEDNVWISNNTVREVMPVCVLNQVRNLYPNPSGHPYMGHRWN